MPISRRPADQCCVGGGADDIERNGERAVVVGESDARSAVDQRAPEGIANTAGRGGGPFRADSESESGGVGRGRKAADRGDIDLATEDPRTDLIVEAELAAAQPRMGVKAAAPATHRIGKARLLKAEADIGADIDAGPECGRRIKVLALGRPVVIEIRGVGRHERAAAKQRAKDEAGPFHVDLRIAR